MQIGSNIRNLGAQKLKSVNGHVGFRDPFFKIDKIKEANAKTVCKLIEITNFWNLISEFRFPYLIM